MKTKAVSLFSVIVILLSSISLSSCSNDDEDGIWTGGTNLVGIWAVLDYYGDTEVPSTHELYIIKADGSIALLYNWDFLYDDGYLVDKYHGYPQEEIEKEMEEWAADETYKCTFSNNTFYWQGTAMAKITVIDKETVKMESAFLGKETLHKVKEVIGERSFDYDGSDGQTASLLGKWIGVDMERNQNGTYNVHYLFELDDRGRLSIRPLEGVYHKSNYGNGYIESPLSQDELDRLLHSNPSVFKFCQKKNNKLYCNNEQLATIEATSDDEFVMVSTRWGKLRLLPKGEDVGIISSQNQNDWN